MATQPTFYNDGQWTTGFQVGANLVKYPFENYSAPDVYARNTYLSFRILPAGYSPLMAVRTSYTNYALYNATFANAAWTKTNITNVDNSYANPDTGEATMASGLETVTNAEHAYQQAYTFTAVPHTISFIVVPNGRTWFRLKANDGTTNFSSFFNASGSGTVGTQSNCTGAITLLATGYYLVTISGFTPAAAAGNIYLNYSTDGSTVSYVGDVTKGAYVWGAGIYRAASVGPVIITLGVSRTISSPDWQASIDQFSYLIWESDFTLDQIQRASFQRMYGRIPKEQTAYPGSEYFSLPAVTNDFNGVSSLPVYPQISGLVQINGVGFYNQAASAIFTEYQSALYGQTKSAGSRIAGYATGGTFTLTYGANTTGSLNWNDSGATIATALNALTSITSAGLTALCTNALNTVTGGDLIIQWSVGSTLTPVTMNASLTMTTSNHPITSISSSLQQDILMADHVTVTSHGLNTSNSIAGVYATRNVIVVFPTTRWGSIDANTIWVPTAAAAGDLSFVGGYNRSYPVGVSVLLRVRELEDYYLPGVTSGITTPADIPVPSDLQNPVNFITAALTLSGFQTYKSQGASPWMNSLIYVLKKVQINMSDF